MRGWDSCSSFFLSPLLRAEPMTQKNRSVALLFMFLLLALIAPQAGAAYVATPAVEGLSGGTYKPLTMPNLTGANFAASGKIWVNGRYVTIPGYIPPASTAAAAAKNALWLNPFLVGLSLLTWSGDAGLSSGTDGWEFTDPSASPQTILAPLPPEDPLMDGCRFSGLEPGYGYCDGSMSACRSAYAPLINDRTCVAVGRAGAAVVGNTGQGYNEEGPLPGGLTPYADFPAGCEPIPGTTQCTQGVETRPATVEDFNSLPSPPPQALAELAPQVGVPVDAPVYEPADVAIGSPYTSSTGATFQPMAKISPQPNGDVMVDTYDLPLTDSTGQPITNPTPEDTTETPPPESQCDKYPNTVGCTDLGTPVDGELLPHVEVPLSFTPVAIAADATCPASMTVSAFGKSVPVSYDAACTYASGLKPIVIAIAYLSALFIIFGVPRASNG